MTSNNFIRCLRGTPSLSKLMAAGCFTYSKSGDPFLYVVLPGVSHSDAWRTVMGELQ